MSGQNDNTSKNIDDFFANIATEPAPKTSGDSELDALFGGTSTPEPTSVVGLDEDFLNQLGSDNAFNLEPSSNIDVGAVGGSDFSGFDNGSSLDNNNSFDNASLNSFDNGGFGASGEPNTINLQKPTPDSGIDLGDVALGGAGMAASAAAGAVLQNQPSTDEPETPKKKGFFSGRFGKKDDAKQETPAKRPARPARKPVVKADEAGDKKAKPAFSLFGKKDKTPKVPTTPVDNVQADNLNGDMGETPVAQDKPKKGLFGMGAKSATPKAPRAAKAPRQAKPAKAQGADGKKNNLPLLLGGLLAVAIAGGAGYMLFLKEEPMPAPPPPPPVAEQQAPAPAPTTDIMPTTNTVNPDEILNAEVPNDPALVKEEIDRLKDTDTRLNEQGKIAEEQLTVMEELTTAKAEQIALLEAQIKELEKQKANAGAVPAPQSAAGQTPPPATPAPAQ